MIASGITVLVVDEDRVTGEWLEGLLSREGYRVLIARTADWARALASECHPEIVLVDVALGGTEDLALLRDLKRGDRRTVAIVVTSAASVPLARDAMSLDAYAYLTKPFDPELLKSIVREGLRDRARRGERSACAR
jgi:DNA-binding NtrC family response regulator